MLFCKLCCLLHWGGGLLIPAAEEKHTHTSQEGGGAKDVGEKGCRSLLPPATSNLCHHHQQCNHGHHSAAWCITRNTLLSSTVCEIICLEFTTNNDVYLLFPLSSSSHPLVLPAQILIVATYHQHYSS